MPNLANLNYTPLTAHPSKEELAAYRAAREVMGYDETAGFDEQKAPVTSGGGDSELWERRYRFNAFAEANGMSYVFRTNPGRWPGQVKGSTTMSDVLQGSSNDGLRFMACAQEIVKNRGAVSARDIQTNRYAVVAVQANAKTHTVFLNHKWQTHPDAAELLEANYNASDPYSVGFASRGRDKDYDSVRSLLTRQVLEPILKLGSDYGLYVSGGWLYLMKQFGWTSAVKKHADPALLRSQFELVAQVAPALTPASDEATQPAPAPEGGPQQRKRSEREEARSADLDRQAQAFVQKLMDQEKGKNPDGGRA